MKTLLFFVLAVPFAFCQETQNPPSPQTQPVPADTTAQAPPAAPATPPPAPGLSFLATDKTVTDLYGPLPVGFLKLAPGKNPSIMIGALPTLMGAESTFTFQNMNIERGLLWNQENAITRGIQVNQTMGKFTASLSWNDGFYSNRYS